MDSSFTTDKKKKNLYHRIIVYIFPGAKKGGILKDKMTNGNIGLLKAKYVRVILE